MQKLMKRFHKNQKGFTLVELMVVVVIIGILVAIAIPIYNTIQTNAEINACQANQRTLAGMYQVYRAGGGAAVTDFTSLSGALVPNFVAAIPLCPATPAGTYTFTPSTGLVTCSIAAHNIGSTP